MANAHTRSAPLNAPLNATAASILGFLEHEPMSGWDLAVKIEDIIGDFWNVTKSQIYRELKLLDEAGLVTTMRKGEREKQPYRITEPGRRAFRAWIAREPSAPIMRMPLVLQVFFAEAVDPEELARSLAKLRAYHVSRLEAYRGFERIVDKKKGPYQSLRLGIGFQKLMIDWIDSLPVAKKKSPKSAKNRKSR
jgi:DNA-binding PadR family transcriptional regulator